MEQGQQWKWDKAHVTDPSAIAKNALPGVKNYVRDEMLGFDDFGRTAKYAKEGNWWGAVKSGLTGAAELGLTIATAGVGSSAGKAVAKPVVKSAIKKAVGTEAAVQAGKKADTSAFKYNPFKKEPTVKTETKEDFKAKEEPKAKEESKAKEDPKNNRKNTFLKGAAVSSLLGLGSDGKGDGPWTPSAIV
jgi:hypothetical protein